MGGTTKQVAQTARRAIPRWQIAIILIGFPSLYMVNSFMPWSEKLFGSNDHDAWFPFWASVFVLHWTSVAAAFVVMRRRGWTLRDVGIALGGRRRMAMVVATIGVGAGAVVVRETFGRLEALGIADLVDLWSEVAKPRTAGERVVWILSGVITAAFFEEFVYRGFGLHALRSRGVGVASAAILASLAWIGVHGLGGIFGFPLYAAVAVLLTGLVVATGSLVPSIAVHSAVHVFVILGS